MKIYGPKMKPYLDDRVLILHDLYTILISGQNNYTKDCENRLGLTLDGQSTSYYTRGEIFKGLQRQEKKNILPDNDVSLPFNFKNAHKDQYLFDDPRSKHHKLM